MDKILSLKKLEDHKTGKPSQDSCLSIFLIKSNDKYFSFQVEENTKSDINKIANLGANFGYFQYKKYKVFVLTRDYFYDFFDKTTDILSFNFIYKTPNIKYNPREENYLNIWHYKYENGRFSEEGPPQLEELKN